MKKILFRIGTKTQRDLGLGDAYIFLNSAYFKGKELGYDDITYESPIKVGCDDEYRHGKMVPCPSGDIYPLSIKSREEINLKDYDKVIDFTDADALFPGYRPLYELKTDELGEQNQDDIWGYLNLYYEKTGKHPVMPMKKDKVDKPYILIHFRNLRESNYRNPDPKIMWHLFSAFKKRYGDKYEIWKTGEPFRFLDRRVDKVIPTDRENINKFITLMKNASFYIGAGSGTTTVAEMFGIPRIVVEEPKFDDNGGPGPRTKAYWKNRNGYGESIWAWQDPNEYMIFYKEDGIDAIVKSTVIEFADKWLKK